MAEWLPLAAEAEEPALPCCAAAISPSEPIRTAMLMASASVLALAWLMVRCVAMEALRPLLKQKRRSASAMSGTATISRRKADT